MVNKSLTSHDDEDNASDADSSIPKSPTLSEPASSRAATLLAKSPKHMQWHATFYGSIHFTDVDRSTKIVKKSSWQV